MELTILLDLIAKATTFDTFFIGLLISFLYLPLLQRWPVIFFLVVIPIQDNNHPTFISFENKNVNIIVQGIKGFEFLIFNVALKRFSLPKNNHTIFSNDIFKRIK